MVASGRQLDAEARDAANGIKTAVSKLAAKKRAERLAREAKDKKRGR